MNWSILILNFATFFVAFAVAWFWRGKLTRRKSEAPLDFFKRMIIASPLPIFYLDLEERYIFANDSYLQHCGHKSIQGHTLFSAMEEKAYKDIAPAYKKALSGDMASIEIMLELSGRMPFYIHMLFAPCFDSNGRVEGVVVFSKDITVRKSFEIALQENQNRLEFALQSARMGTWDIILPQRTVNCSPEFLELWGVTQEEFDGNRSKLQTKVHPEDLSKMNAAIDEAILNNKIYELEYRIYPTPGIERWVLSRGRCTFTPGCLTPARFSGVAFDITERKAKENALAAAVKSRDQFFMIAGHELKTPLTCLQLQTHVIQWDLKNKYPEAFTPEKIEADLRKQQAHLLRITRLVDNILDESKISEGRLNIQLEHFELNEMVTEVLERFRVTAEYSDIEVQFRSAQNISGKWDRFRLEQVLINLLMNAIRYGKKNPIHVEVTQEGEHALMIVRDQGIGIKAEDQIRVFERFQRAIPESDIRGMGLGLYISNSIVRAHGGEIRLKSEYGKGSEFVVAIPCKIVVSNPCTPELN